MNILIDADGCPVVNLTLQIAKRFVVPVIILCDTSHQIEREGAQTLVFDKGADSVDFALVNRVKSGDVVVTQDYGLMYGGGGAGGAGGATTGAPQGETGGAEAGRADGAAAQQAAAIQQAQMGLGLVSMKKDLAMKDAQIDEINAAAAKQRAEAAHIAEQKITEMQMRPVRYRELLEKGKGEYIRNLESYFEDAMEGGENDRLDAYDDMFGEHSIIGRRLKTRQGTQDVLNTQAQIYERQQNAAAAKALAELNTEKKKYVYMEALAAAMNANAHMLEARAKELATLFETGEYTNWKTWADYAAQGAQMLTDIAGRVIGFRAGAKALRGPQNATTRVDVPTIYGADGKPTARMIW